MKHNAMCVTDRHDMTLAVKASSRAKVAITPWIHGVIATWACKDAVKEALNLNTLVQPTNQTLSIFVPYDNYSLPHVLLGKRSPFKISFEKKICWSPAFPSFHIMFFLPKTDFIFNHIYSVVCKYFEFGPVYKLVVW